MTTTPQDVTVWIGLDVSKEEHFAGVLDATGERLLARSLPNDQGAPERLLDKAQTFGAPALVIGILPLVLCEQVQ